MSDYRLEILTGSRKGQSFVLSGDSPLLLGRGDECQVMLDDPSISRQHARISLKSGSPYIEDLDSKNGVRVAGAAISASTVELNTVFKVGQVQARIVAEGFDMDTPPETLPVPSFREAPASNPPFVELAGGAEILVGAQNSPGRTWAFGIFAALMLLCAIWVLARSFHSSGPPIEKIFLKAGEERLFYIKDFVELNNMNYPETLTLTDPRVIQASFDGDERKWILWVKVLDWGTSSISLFNRTGGHMLNISVEVQGQLEPPSDIVEMKHLNDAERLGRAEKAFLEGSAMVSLDPFRAIGRLQIVLDLFETVSTRPDFYFQAREQHKVAEANLTTRLAGHWERMRIARKNEDPFLALTELNGIIDLIPDPQHLEYQRATIYKRRIKEIILAEKK